MQTSGRFWRNGLLLVLFFFACVGFVMAARGVLNVALFYASATGKLGLASALLRIGADANAREHEGETPLMYAAAEGQTGTIALLLSKDARINAVSDNNESALARAVLNGKTDAVKFLVNKGAALDTDGTGTTLGYAAAFSDGEIVKFLLDRGTQVNARDSCGATALVHAVFHDRRPEILQLLVAAGADVNVKNCKGRTVLQDALERGHLETTVFLRHAGARN